MTALKPRRIDLYQSFFEKIPKTRQQEQHTAKVLLPILLLVVMAGCYGFLQMEIYNLNKQIAPVATYLNTVDTQTLHQRADTLQLEDDRLSVIADKLIKIDAAADSYPHLSNAMLNAVYSQAEGKATIAGLTYSSDTGMLSIQAEATRPEDGQSYIEGLRRTGYFAALTHTGYSGGSALDVGLAVYNFEIFAMLPTATEVQVLK